jgi:hypothetical protein
MLVATVLLPALLIVSTVGQARPFRATEPPEACAVTRDSNAFVPPPPHDPAPPFSGRFWLGTGDLWTMPFANGLWHGLATPRGVRDKVFWWSRNWDWRTDHRPQLTVSARRLDGAAPALRVSPATNAHAADIHHAMLVALDLPTPGCWEITGEYKGRRLSYVVWVP